LHLHVNLLRDHYYWMVMGYCKSCFVRSLSFHCVIYLGWLAEMCEIRVQVHGAGVSNLIAVSHVLLPPWMPGRFESGGTLHP
jgi:hypothetical protein